MAKHYIGLKPESYKIMNTQKKIILDDINLFREIKGFAPESFSDIKENRIIDFENDIKSSYKNINELLELNKVTPVKKKKRKKPEAVKNETVIANNKKINIKINGYKSVELSSIVIEKLEGNFIEITNPGAKEELINCFIENNKWLKLNSEWFLAEANAINATVLTYDEYSFSLIMPASQAKIKIKIDILKTRLIKNKNECELFINDGINEIKKTILQFYSKVSYHSVPCLIWPCSELDNTKIIYYNSENIFAVKGDLERKKIEKFEVTVKSIVSEILKVKIICKEKTFKEAEEYVMPFTSKNIFLKINNEILKNQTLIYEDMLVIECGEVRLNYKFYFNKVILKAQPQEILLEDAYPNFIFPSSTVKLKSDSDSAITVFKPFYDNNATEKLNEFCFDIHNTLNEKLDLSIEPLSDFESNFNYQSLNKSPYKAVYDKTQLINFEEKANELLSISNEYSYHVKAFMKIDEKNLPAMVPLYDNYDKIYFYRFFKITDRIFKSEIVLKTGFSINIINKLNYNLLKFEISNNNIEFNNGRSNEHSITIINNNKFPIILKKIFLDDDNIKIKFINNNSFPIEIKPGETISYKINFNNSYYNKFSFKYLTYQSIIFDIGYFNLKRYAINIECTYKSNWLKWLIIINIVITGIIMLKFMKFF